MEESLIHRYRTVLCVLIRGSLKFEVTNDDHHQIGRLASVKSLVCVGDLIHRIVKNDQPNTSDDLSAEMSRGIHLMEVCFGNI
jgi:hypothetical protein